MRSEVYNAILKYWGYGTGCLFPCISVGITRQPIPEQLSQGQLLMGSFFFPMAQRIRNVPFLVLVLQTLWKANLRWGCYSHKRYAGFRDAWVCGWRLSDPILLLQHLKKDVGNICHFSLRFCAEQVEVLLWQSLERTQFSAVGKDPGSFPTWPDWGKYRTNGSSLCNCAAEWEASTAHALW